MPVYEYECSECARVFEVQQRMSEAPLTECSVCGGEVKKLVSMSSFHLKGGGWYSDGYSSGSTGGDSGGDSTSPEKKGSKSGEKQPAGQPCKGGESAACRHCPAAG